MLNFKGKFAVVDLETTGIDPETSRIVQFGALLGEDGEITSEVNILVNPGVPIDPAASAVHGITDARVAEALQFPAVAPSISSVLSGRQLLGYNVTRYDFPIIEAEARRHEVHLNLGSEMSEAFDLLVWVREFERYVRGTGRHTLTTTCKRHGVPVEDAHDALGDCRMTWGLLGVFESKFFAKFSVQELVKRQAAVQKKQEDEFRAYQARNARAGS